MTTTKTKTLLRELKRRLLVFNYMESGENIWILIVPSSDFHNSQFLLRHFFSQLVPTLPKLMIFSELYIVLVICIFGAIFKDHSFMVWFCFEHPRYILICFQPNSSFLASGRENLSETQKTSREDMLRNVCIYWDYWDEMKGQLSEEYKLMQRAHKDADNILGGNRWCFFEYM